MKQLTDIQRTEAVRTVLDLDKPLTPAEISSAVGFDIGPYNRILGPMEAKGEIERVGKHVRRKPERLAVVTGEELG